MGLWAGMHSCEQDNSPYTPTSANPGMDLICHQHAGCAGGALVASCTYPGQHGDWPAQYVEPRAEWDCQLIGELNSEFPLRPPLRPGADDLVWSLFTSVSQQRLAASIASGL